MIMNDENNALTTPNFWDNYWSTIKLPTVAISQVQWQLALMNKFKEHLPTGRSLKLFEVGGAPGRWLIWFNQEMKYQIYTCDTSPYGIELTRENLRLNNVKGEIYQADFLTGALAKNSFDIVVSIGFIEHFDDPMPVIARHVDLVKPGGYLVLEVPNLAGQLNLRLLRMAGMHDLISVHNLQIMNKPYFQQIAEKFELQIEFLDYVGGFDPKVVTGSYPHRVRHVLRTRHFIVPLLVLFDYSISRLLLNSFIRYNAPYFSSMLLGIFRVKDSKG